MTSGDLTFHRWYFFLWIKKIISRKSTKPFQARQSKQSPISNLATELSYSFFILSMELSGLELKFEETLFHFFPFLRSPSQWENWGGRLEWFWDWIRSVVLQYSNLCFGVFWIQFCQYCVSNYHDKGFHSVLRIVYVLPIVRFTSVWSF